MFWFEFRPFWSRLWDGLERILERFCYQLRCFFSFFYFWVGVGGVMYIQTGRRQNTLTIMEKWTHRQTERYTAWRRAERILCIPTHDLLRSEAGFFQDFPQVCVFICVCVYACMNLCVYVSMCMHVYICIRVCVCVSKSKIVCICARIYISRDPHVCVVSSFCSIPSFRRCGSKFSISCTYVRANNFP